LGRPDVVDARLGGQLRFERLRLGDEVLEVFLFAKVKAPVGQASTQRGLPYSVVRRCAQKVHFWGDVERVVEVDDVLIRGRPTCTSGCRGTCPVDDHRAIGALVDSLDVARWDAGSIVAVLADAVLVRHLDLGNLTRTLS